MRRLEGELGEAFRRMAEMASNPTLKSVLMDQGERSLAQEQRLWSMLCRHDANPRAHTDQAMLERFPIKLNRERFNLIGKARTGVRCFTGHNPSS